MKKASYFLITFTLVFAAFVGGLFVGKYTQPSSIDLIGVPSATNATAPISPEIVTDEITPVDLNTATLEELNTLPGIGPVLAKRILDYRDLNCPFKDISELTNVPGISSGKLNAITDYIYTGGQYEDSGS